MLRLCLLAWASMACLAWADDPKILIRSANDSGALQAGTLSPDMQVIESSLRIFKAGSLINPKVFDGAVLVNSVVSTKSIPAVALNLDAAESKSIDVGVWDTDESAAVIKMGENQFALGGLGEVKYLIITVDADWKISKKYLAIQFPEPKPGPGPEPIKPDPVKPDSKLPPDFDQIAKRVNEWSAGLTKRKEVADNYRAYATLLRKPQGTINSISEAMVTTRNGILGDPAPWNQVLSPVNADLQTIWPLSKGVLADYWDCIAAGLDPAGYRPKTPLSESKRTPLTFP